ncbi:MAG: hypothetical protein IPG80_21275 [Anaerolineales bacterium]|uniref:hypothetical protein n=1 Tax=Candidatus Villigracilis vicinus TaxID=3140679 RepID=UPI003135814F|nr:hypothetical protein [Anaerolineales bacterium]
MAVRVGLGLHPQGVTSLHIRRPEDPEAGTDAPFKPLERVLYQIPEVQKSSKSQKMRRKSF